MRGTGRLLLLLLLLGGVGQVALAQKKLPSAEKIVDYYLKAIGGKKTAAARKDATYEWIVQFNNQPIGTARTQRKAPASERWELTFGNGQIITGTNARSAWEIGLDNRLRTLTGAESAAAKLRASLDSSRLINFKKANVLARVVSLGDLASEPAYIVPSLPRASAPERNSWLGRPSLVSKRRITRVRGSARQSPREDVIQTAPSAAIDIASACIAGQPSVDSKRTERSAVTPSRR